ncbi:hypothetical protein Tco_0940850 [Tanacetum coccineum]|uniref:Uncharacterized protein n=1 Tax=Tanacetum coccineum TaxID=301880 RepID=A0ABQ5DP63_9ASTR
MDEVYIEDLTIEQYLRLTQESQTPKKIEDMTIAEYLEYEKKVPKETKLESFLLPFNINNHNLYATTTLDANGELSCTKSLLIS